MDSYWILLLMMAEDHSFSSDLPARGKAQRAFCGIAVSFGCMVLLSLIVYG